MLRWSLGSLLHLGPKERYNLLPHLSLKSFKIVSPATSDLAQKFDKIFLKLRDSTLKHAPPNPLPTPHDPLLHLPVVRTFIFFSLLLKGEGIGEIGREEMREYGCRLLPPIPLPQIFFARERDLGKSLYSSYTLR